MSYKKIASTLALNHYEWLEIRKQGLGGSDIAGILNLSPWSSPTKVYIDKTEESIKEQEDSERMRQGRDLEEYVAQRFAEQTGKKLRRENHILQSVENPFMLANLDRVVIGEKSILECKTTSAFNKSKWEDGVPLHYELQCLHYLAVTGFEKCYLAVCFLGDDFRYYEINRDEETINNLIEAERNFWESYVEKGQMPGVDGSTALSEAIKEKYKFSKPESIELDESFNEKLERRKVINELIDQLETEKKQIDQAIQLEMKDNEVAIVGENIITWKTQTSTRLDTKTFKKDQPELFSKYGKESTSRVFRIK